VPDAERSPGNRYGKGCLLQFLSGLGTLTIVVVSIVALKLAEKIFLNGLADEIRRAITPGRLGLGLVGGLLGLLVAAAVCYRNRSLRMECVKTVIGAFIVMTSLLMLSPRVLPALADYLPDLTALGGLFIRFAVGPTPMAISTPTPSPSLTPTTSPLPQPTPNVCENVPASDYRRHPGADYQIQPGGTLDSVARDFKTTRGVLIRRNLDIHPTLEGWPNCLREGIWLRVPEPNG